MYFSSIRRWERLGDIVVLPVTSFKDPAWSSISEEVWSAVAISLSANRLARQVCLSVTFLFDSCSKHFVSPSPICICFQGTCGSQRYKG